MLFFFRSQLHATHWKRVQIEKHSDQKVSSDAGTWERETTTIFRKRLFFRLLRGIETFGVLFAIFLVSDAIAGAVGSNWVVVVNGHSVTSRTIANRYCTARNIPGRNVIVLPNIPDSDQISVDQFRELILSPVIQKIEIRGLGAHIQGIAYTSTMSTD